MDGIAHNWDRYPKTLLVYRELPSWIFRELLSEALFELALLWSQAGLARDEEPVQVQHEDAFKKKWPKQAGDTLGFSEELGLGKTKTPIF